MKKTLTLIYQWFVFTPLFIIITILTALSVILGCSLVGRRFWAYTPPRWWSRAVCCLALCPIKVRGIEHLEPDKAYVFTPNHQSYFDIFIIYGYLPKNIKWVQKQPLRKLPFVGKASEIAGHVFVDQSSIASRKKSIQQAEHQLQKEPGVSMVIFPEGARSHTGKLTKFKRGAFFIAQQLRLPIVPITLNGVHEVLPRGSRKLTPGTMELIIHPPIDTTSCGEEHIQALCEQTQQTIESSLWPHYK